MEHENASSKDTRSEGSASRGSGDQPYRSVPRELIERRQWVCFKRGVKHRRKKPDEITKVPYNARTGTLARTTDPATWSTFEEALAGVKQWSMQGIGYVFAEDDPYLGLDLDHCRDKDSGAVAEWAAGFIQLLDSYTQVSLSREGFHVFVRAPAMEHGLARKYQGGKVELYTSDRFFAMTDEHVPGTPRSIEERGAQVQGIRATVWAGATDSASAEPDKEGWFAPPTCGVTGLTDEEVLQRCRSDREGETFTAVYDDGDLSDFEYDDSAADFFIWRKVTFYVGDDWKQIARLAEQGAHYLRPGDGAARAERAEKWRRPYPPYRTLQERQIAYLLAGRGPDRMFGGEARAEGAGTGASPKVQPWPEPLADVAYYGVLGDIAKGIEPYIEADSAALLINLLVASGIVIGRQAYFQIGAARHYAVLYAVTVGETSDRKGDSTTPLRALLSRLNATVDPASGIVAVYEPAVLSGLSTGEGLLWQVRDERHEQKQKRDPQTHSVITEDVLVDAGVPDKRLLVSESEFARVLSVMYRDGNTLSTTLRNLFDSPPEEKSSPKNSPVIATAPHVGIIGQITPHELERKMHDGELYNGFANRYLWPLTHRIVSRPTPPDYTAKAEEHARWWAEALDRAARVNGVRRDHRAVAQWEAKYEPLKQRERPGMAKDVCSRADVLVTRISLIFAALDGSSVITVAHQEAAFAIWEYCERCAVYLFGDLAGDPIENVIAEALRLRGKMRRNDLRALFSRHVESAAIQVALDALVRAGKVRTFAERTEGRSIEWWEWVEAA